MEKINYGDINRFLASAGVLLIGLSILIPYFYLKEDFGIYIEQDKVANYQDSVKEILVSKQSLITKIQKSMLMISGVLFCLGGGILTWGIVRWNKRQVKINEKFDKEIQKLDLEIVALTSAEKAEKVENEIKEIEKVEEKTEPVQSRIQYVKDFMDIEAKIADVFIVKSNQYFNVLSQQKIGNRYRIDLILQSKSSEQVDRIVEIKYFKNRLPIQMIKDIIFKFNTQLSYFNNVSMKSAVPILLVVYNNQTTTKEDRIKFENKLREESQDLPNLKDLRIEFIDETKIEEFDVMKVVGT